MKISIVIVLLSVIAILLGISSILADEQKKLFNSLLSSKSRGVYKYINTSCDSFKKLKKYARCRSYLHLICIIVIAVILLYLKSDF